MVKKNIYELQPLRIQSGWKVEFNSFTEYDLLLHDKNVAFDYLSEDLLQLHFSRNNVELLIDLGWYPSGDIDGNYKLVMLKDFNWEFPIEKLITKSKNDVIYQIEYWCCYGFFSKHL